MATTTVTRRAPGPAGGFGPVDDRAGQEAGGERQDAGHRPPQARVAPEHQQGPRAAARGDAGGLRAEHGAPPGGGAAAGEAAVEPTDRRRWSTGPLRAGGSSGQGSVPRSAVLAASVEVLLVLLESVEEPELLSEDDEPEDEDPDDDVVEVDDDDPRLSVL